MKKGTLLAVILLTIGISGIAQKKINPVIKGFGGIYDIQNATVKPDQEEYNIVIDVVTRKGDEKSIAFSLINVARLINLHAVGGVSPENINVVLAIHGPMTYTILNNDAYRKRFEVDNPNIELIKSLKNSGVKITVCGQSMIGREVSSNEILQEVDIATSMLTTVTTYQLKGYAMLKF